MNYDIPLQNICMDLFLKFWPRGNAIVLKPRRNFHFTPRNKIPNIYSEYTYILGDPEVTANIYYKSCNLANTDKQIYSTDLR